MEGDVTSISFEAKLRPVMSVIRNCLVNIFFQVVVLVYYWVNFDYLTAPNESLYSCLKFSLSKYIFCK